MPFLAINMDGIMDWKEEEQRVIVKSGVRHQATFLSD